MTTIDALCACDYLKKAPFGKTWFEKVDFSIWAQSNIKNFWYYL